MPSDSEASPREKQETPSADASGVTAGAYIKTFLIQSLSVLDTVYNGGSQPSLENLLKLYRYLAK